MTYHRIHWLVRTTTSLTMGAFLGSFIAYAFESPPISLLSFAERDGVSTHGGRIELMVHISASRVCDKQTDRELWRWEDRDGVKTRVIVPLPLRSSAIISPGDHRFVVSLDVPPGTPAGDWFYAAQSRNTCVWLPGLFGNSILRTGDIPVRIEGAAAPETPVTVSRTPDGG